MKVIHERDNVNDHRAAASDLTIKFARAPPLRVHRIVITRLWRLLCGEFLSATKQRLLSPLGYLTQHASPRDVVQPVLQLFVVISQQPVEKGLAAVINCVR